MSSAGSCTPRFGVPSGSVIGDPVDGASGARCPGDCFGLVSFWDGVMFQFGFVSFFYYYFNLMFSWSEFFLLPRVKLSARPSKGRVPFVPAPASSSRSCPAPSSSAALATQGRDKCGVFRVCYQRHASYEHVLCSPSTGAPQVAVRRSAYARKLTLTREGGSGVVYSLSIWLFPFCLW